MHAFSYLPIGVEVFVEIEYLCTKKIRWGGQGIIRASHRKDPVIIKSTIRLLCCSKDEVLLTEPKKFAILKPSTL